MILRVYAMWGRSRTILRVLLFIFIVQTISGVIFVAIYINPNTYMSGKSWGLVASMHLIPPFSPVTVVQIQDFSNASLCNILLSIPLNLTIYFTSPRFTLSVVLFTLALTQTLKESVAMYQATKQWQPSRYMRLLAEHGIIYFFTYVDRFLRFICPPHLPQHLPPCIMFLNNRAQTIDSNELTLNQDSTLQYRRNNHEWNRVCGLQLLDDLPGQLYLSNFCYHHASVHHQRAGIV